VRLVSVALMDSGTRKRRLSGIRSLGGRWLPWSGTFRHPTNAMGYFGVSSPIWVRGTVFQGSGDRSAHLTIFWRCGLSQFSSRTGAEAPAGNEPSMVLAEDRASKGSGNADSQRNAWSSREIGRYCRCLRDSGCVPAHPASLRASASYLPLRAVWAVCAWALRGCARSSDPFSA
jgi:hypothetical protein